MRETQRTPAMGPSTRRTRRLTVLPAAALAVLALVAGACTPAPEAGPEQVVAGIVDAVERLRGHDFLEEPAVEFVDPATFEADVLADLASREASIAADRTAFVALDWIDASQDLLTEYRKTYGGGVVGYYDPSDATLRVRGTELTPYRREVVAHELTHALDDQLFDLSGLDSDGLLDEEYLAQLVAIEGSAERVRSRYAASFGPFETLQSLAEQLEAGSDPELLTIPITLLTLTSAPYLAGVRFQRELAAELGDPEGIDLSLTRYPANTEQGFDPAKYLADEPAEEVPAPPTDAGAPVVRSGEFGPLLISLVLREGIVLDEVDPVASGWNGGSYTSWESAIGACIRVDTHWDGPDDAAAVRAAFTSWGSAHGGTTVLSPSPVEVRFTRCDT